jgi:Sigma-70 region 2
VTDSAATFQAQRRRLLGLAYRLLGAASDAEDVVQDAYLRWSAADPDSVHDPTAWLTTVVVNLCRNRLTSARARRERYVGTWLPEPVLTARLAELATGPPAGRVPDMGGPEIRSAGDLVHSYLEARGRRRLVLPVRLPGAAFAGYRSGYQLAPDHAVGRVTFAQFLAERFGHAAARGSA